MKKLLLIAAMAAMTLGASADGYKIEKVWEISDMSFLPSADTRQGFGMNGKFYINNKADQTVYVVDQNGLTGETFPGGANCGISRDEAGNIVVSNATFPGAWSETASIKVINPSTNEVIEHIVPVEYCSMSGRSDFIGFPKGNLMEDGVFYFTGNTNDGVCVMTITGGEVDEDYCYLATCDGLSRDNMTIANYYTDINGNENVLFVYRSGRSVLKNLTPDGENFTATTITLPEKGASNGTFPFIWDNKQMFLYPTFVEGNYSNYRDGLAIAEANAEAPLILVPHTATTNPNAFQANWLNAEVDADGVTIYQYVPGYCLRVWRLTKDEPAPEIPNVWILGQANDKDWNPTDGVLMDYDAENNVYVANVYFDGRGESGENYFSFTTELAENNDQGGWDYILPFRFGAYSDDYKDFWYDDMYDGQPLTLTYDSFQAFRIMSGDYELVLDKNAMTLTIHRWELGDVNHSRGVDIEDVTILINRVLGNTTEVFFPNQANCTLDEAGSIDIEDVTALINRVLNGSWQ